MARLRQQQVLDALRTRIGSADELAERLARVAHIRPARLLPRVRQHLRELRAAGAIEPAQIVEPGGRVRYRLAAGQQPIGSWARARALAALRELERVTGIVALDVRDIVSGRPRPGTVFAGFSGELAAAGMSYTP